jgi:hypothetical protein
MFADGFRNGCRSQAEHVSLIEHLLAWEGILDRTQEIANGIAARRSLGIPEGRLGGQEALQVLAKLPPADLPCRAVPGRAQGLTDVPGRPAVQFDGLTLKLRRQAFNAVAHEVR